MVILLQNFVSDKNVHFRLAAYIQCCWSDPEKENTKTLKKNTETNLYLKKKKRKMN